MSSAGYLLVGVCQDLELEPDLLLFEDAKWPGREEGGHPGQGSVLGKPDVDLYHRSKTCLACHAQVILVQSGPCRSQGH